MKILLGTTSVLFFFVSSISEVHYNDAIEYTQNVAATDMEIVEAMGQYGFNIWSPFDDISNEDKIEALFMDREWITGE